MKASSMVLLVLAVALAFGGVLAATADSPSATSAAVPSLSSFSATGFDTVANEPAWEVARQAYNANR